ncbi:hypothetical protein NCCP2716_17890 [Sporosarcina sp. NCCP-2716]|uniref:competence protein ComK n=1 Tax=Sporosarcina sp. NCCP-2716 TaxID=2943679 RepID=UPI00203EEE8D|nr:competence protein ComK [Sporosarcina sp. NCCP-2716]GKV69291.1 hypothetical protein NCCP2716_17890 [Sporosarcina sp. NCCP-2716]
MMCDSYLLDSEALALLGYEDEEGSRSMVVTTHGTYLSAKPPIELLNVACLRNGSTKLARQQEARIVLQSRQKVPFLLSADVGVFPTSSSRHQTCTWVFNHYFEAEAAGKKETILRFSSGIELTVPTSAQSIRLQHGRLMTLLSHSAQQQKDLYFEQSIHHAHRTARR